jgi:hypothetical protein
MPARAITAHLLLLTTASPTPQLIKFGEKTVGGPFTWSVLKHTFAAQYTGGETVKQVTALRPPLFVLPSSPFHDFKLFFFSSFSQTTSNAHARAFRASTRASVDSWNQ